MALTSTTRKDNSGKAVYPLITLADFLADLTRPEPVPEEHEKPAKTLKGAVRKQRRTLPSPDPPKE